MGIGATLFTTPIHKYHIYPPHLYNPMCGRVYTLPHFIFIMTKKDWEKKVEEITKDVLKKIKPSPRDQTKIFCEVGRIIGAIKEGLGDDVKCVIGGSVGKGTNLK